MRVPYRPRTGTEGADFECKWCQRCRRDEAFPEGDGCEILSSAHAGKQPEEWHWWRGAPICDAFDGEQYPHHPGFAVRDLFPSAPRRPTAGQQIRMMLTPSESRPQ